jgi:AraC-like DNA-binding protein
LGQTPLEYLTQWRMYKAGAMIRSHNASFSEVALAVGYGSESSFSRVFRREMGIAPKEYRRQCALMGSSKEHDFSAKEASNGRRDEYD